ncbi:AraC family transcriptional regulator [Streptomyces sp. A3M-1-3]|uniref:AraC family transcriptional regulator n=1 Tax=Streptomyces sp. A3M-1-3 TaxID=2962044 RepID=UPI0020B71855|nr:AraC family transcriptional regulator [Streptomyces sp. A3M-1-3]MCP3819222.1 AraC family transcriptional regulator [Streptomyces sp. A3M-1-3]
MSRPDPRYGSATVTPHILRYVAVVAAERGCPVGPLLRRAGLGEDDLAAVGLRVSYRQGGRFIREAMTALDDPALGLAVGRRQTVTAWGLLGLGLLSAATVRESLELGMRHQQLAGSMLDFHLEAKGDRATAVVATARYADGDLQALLVEEAFASIVSVIRYANSEAFAPLAVSVRHARPAYAVQYRRHFRCPVRFRTPRDRLVLDDDWLDRTLPTADPYTLATVVGLLDEAAGLGRERRDLVESLEAAVARSLPRPPTLAQQAHQRAVSERTLRRRLGECGTSYQALVDSVRLARTEELLVGTDLPLSRVAAQVGYADVRALRRAVARWFGTSPSAVRRRRQDTAVRYIPDAPEPAVFRQV